MQSITYSSVRGLPLFSLQSIPVLEEKRWMFLPLTAILKRYEGSSQEEKHVCCMIRYRSAVKYMGGVHGKGGRAVTNEQDTSHWPWDWPCICSQRERLVPFMMGETRRDTRLPRRTLLRKLRCIEHQAWKYFGRETVRLRCSAAVQCPSRL